MPPSGNMTFRWWPHDRFISQQSTCCFQFWLSCYVITSHTYTATVKKRAWQVTAGHSFGKEMCNIGPRCVTGATFAPSMWETVSEVYNGHHVQTKTTEEPHGRFWTPEPESASMFRKLQTPRCRKLLQMDTFAHTNACKYTPPLAANRSTKDAPTTRARATGCKTAFRFFSLFIAFT